MSIEREESYQYHPGTIKVSGGSEPKKTGTCAFAFFKKGICPIDFLYMGANAAGQAVKACLDAKARIERSCGVIVSFTPRSTKVETLNPLTGVKKDKIAYYWRLIALGIAESSETSELVTTVEETDVLPVEGERVSGFEEDAEEAKTVFDKSEDEKSEVTFATENSL